MKYTWKLWKRGCVVSGLTGLLSAGGAWALATEMNLKATVALFVGMVAKDLLLYLKQNPVEQVQDTNPEAFIKSAGQSSSSTSTTGTP